MTVPPAVVKLGCVFSILFLLINNNNNNNDDDVSVEANSQLESMIGRHELLVHKLREECQRLVDELQKVSTKYKLFTYNNDLGYGPRKVSMSVRVCRS